MVAKSSRSANAGPTADECRALYATAQRAAGDSWKRASKSCATADDCMLVSKRGCLSDCSGFPIAKRSFAAWKREHEQLEATTCRMYWDGGCNAKVPMPAPTCPTYRTACQDGKCAVAN